jgi:hypothetical protein
LNGESSLGDDIIAATWGSKGELLSSSLSGQAVSQSLNAGLSAAQVSGASSAFLENTATHALGGSLASGGAAGGEIALSIASEIANAAWNSRRYNEANILKRHGLKISWEQQEVKDRIQVLRSVLKPSLERFCTKFSHWLISHDQFKEAMKSGSSDADLAVKALRARKHWAQSIGSDAYKMLCEFHEVVIGTANVEWEKIFGDQQLAEKRERVINEQETTRHKTSVTAAEGSDSRCDELQTAIDAFIASHGLVEPCNGFCYMPARFLPLYFSAFGDRKIPKAYEALPIKPIGSAAKRIEAAFEA